MAKSRFDKDVIGKKIAARNKQKPVIEKLEQVKEKKALKRPTKETKKGRKPFTTMLRADFKKRLKQAVLNSDGEFTVADLIEKYIDEGLQNDRF